MRRKGRIAAIVAFGAMGVLPGPWSTPADAATNPVTACTTLGQPADSCTFSVLGEPGVPVTVGYLAAADEWRITPDPPCAPTPTSSCPVHEPVAGSSTHPPSGTLELLPGTYTAAVIGDGVLTAAALSEG